MLVSEKFTPEVMLSAPRRSVGVPNRDGTLALCTVSTHVFGDKTFKDLKVVDLETGKSRTIAQDDKITEAAWIPSETNAIVYLKKGDKGVTTVMAADVSDLSAKHYTVAELAAPVRGMKLKEVDDGIVFAVVALVGEDGKLFNDEAEERKTTAKIYDSPHVRRWDSYIKDLKHSIWFSQLVKKTDQWAISGELQNLLQDTNLDAPGGTYDVDSPEGHYDISSSGFVFDATSPTPDGSDPHRWNDMHVYYAPIDSFSVAAAGNVVAARRGGPRQVSAGVNFPFSGQCANVRFSPDGTMVGFIFMPESNYADIRVYMAYLAQAAAAAGIFDVFEMVGGGGGHRQPNLPSDGFEFAGDSHTLLMRTQDCGRVTIRKLKVARGARLETVFRCGSMDGFYPLVAGKWDKILVSGTSFVDNSLWQIVDTNMDEAPRVVSSMTKHGARFGLSHKMVSEIWFEGADESCVQSFIIRPSNFDETKKYPWIMTPHGGPESAWNEGWSTRWNMALFAEQGYVVVCPNIAGSTGFGLEFTERIYGSWGGAPYQDLVNLMQYLEELPYLDMNKAVLAGASYGGYMVSWIFGQEFAKKFCCAIWHDGIFSLPTFMLQTDQMDGTADFKGLPVLWENMEELDKWNPARPELLARWKDAPPTLLVHNGRDYRCPMTEGIAAFRTLKAQGVTARFLTFPDENHWVLKPENSIVWHREVLGWMEKYTSVA